MIAGRLENFEKSSEALETVFQATSLRAEVKVESRETIISVVEPPPSHGGQGKDGVKFGLRGETPIARVDALRTTYAGGPSLIHGRKLRVIRQMILDGVWSLTNVTKQQQILVRSGQMRLWGLLGGSGHAGRAFICMPFGG